MRPAHRRQHGCPRPHPSRLGRRNCRPGTLSRFLATTATVIFHPDRFYRTLATRRDNRAALAFARRIGQYRPSCWPRLWYDLSLDDIKQFRQWDSRTPGHPEYGVTPGVEVTTGPLGQGVGNAVGFAIAEAHLAALFNTGGHRPVDHHTWFIASDGDMMEGVSHEAASLAGHLRLGKLIGFYDDNHITIEGDTALAFDEDVGARFRAYGWQVQHVADGNDLDAIDAAIRAANAETGRPSLIVVRTHIAYGSPNKLDTAEAHGSPLGEEEIRLTKQASAGRRWSPSSCPRTRSPNGESAASGARRWSPSGGGATRRSPPPPTRRRSWSGGSAATCPPVGIRTSRPSLPTSPSPPATRRRR